MPRPTGKVIRSFPLINLITNLVFIKLVIVQRDLPVLATWNAEDTPWQAIDTDCGIRILASMYNRRLCFGVYP